MESLLSRSMEPRSFEQLPLFREALEVLMGELTIIAGHKVEDLPELKKKKVLIASRLGKLNRGPLSERESFDLVTIKTLIAELEMQSRKEIQGHIDLLGNQLLAIQEEHQYWRECLNVSFQKFCEPTTDR